MKKIISFFIISTLLFSCKKDVTHEKYNWFVVDAFGNTLNEYDNTTETDFLNTTISMRGETGKIGDILTTCDYYRENLNEPKYCWLLNDSIKLKNVSEAWINLMTSCYWNNKKPIKTDCN